MLKKQNIFISHSSRDEEIINLIEFNFENNQIDKVPYFASRYIVGKNPADKITEAMKDSVALFVIITNNVINDIDTLNWVLFEIGLAKGREIPVFGWKAYDVQKVPKPIEYITEDFDLLLVIVSSLYTFVVFSLVFGGFSKSSTDYVTFNPYEEEDILRIVGVMMDLAIEP